MSVKILAQQKVNAFKATKARSLNNPQALQTAIDSDQAYFQVGSEFLTAAGATAGVSLVDKVLGVLEAEAKVLERQAALDAELNAEEAEGDE